MSAPALGAFNASQRFGSARFAYPHELRRAGLHSKNADSLLIGFHQARALYYSGAGGLLLTAGARAGKLRDVLAYNVCAGMVSGPMAVLDPKGELAAIAQDQTASGRLPGRPVYTWNPCGLHGLPKHRLNPVDYIRWNSASLVSDVKVFAENTVALSGSPQGQYFERRAQEYLEAIALTLTEINGVLSLPDLYHALGLLPTGDEPWLNFAFEMSESAFPQARRIEAEIAAARTSDGSGFQGILGELFKSFTALSDPILMEAVSPPYDLSLEDLTEGSANAQLYLMCPAEFISPWAGVIKSIFTAGMIYKSRRPDAPRQTWILDEAAQLDRFPLLTKLYTYGAGIGLRPWAIFQSTDQLKAVGPDAESIIPASAALKSYFAVRDLGSARAVSAMMGQQTLAYDDDLAQARAEHAKRKAAQALINGGDPFEAALDLSHQKFAASHKAKQQRWLKTPDEVLNMPGDAQVIFADGLAHPIWAARKPYYEQRFMAGRYHPNPYHPPKDKVRVAGRWGQRWANVIRKAVPSRYAHLPQYASGLWSRVNA